MKIFKIFAIGGLSLFFLFPFATEANADYTYRSTVIGSGIKKINDSVYEIVNERNVFSSSDDFYALTRIFRIDGVQNFQFKYELRGPEDRDMFSRLYEPKGAWWSEIWYYDYFGKLQAGNYFLNTYIAVDNGQFKKLDSKAFSVTGYNYQNSYQEYNYNSRTYSTGNASYNYDFIQTGKDIRDAGRYVYNMVNPSDDFGSREDVYALLKLSDLRGIGRFTIRFEVYDGYKLIRSNTTPLSRPNYDYWEYNYAWANLGRLPEGDYQIRALITFDGHTPKRVATKNIEVLDLSYTNDRYDYSDWGYDYNWTWTDDNVIYDGDYKYRMDAPRDVFARDEDVKVLTRLSNIKNIDEFKIRHDLLRYNTFVEKKESSTRRPNGRYWEYNYTQSNFGELDPGDYKVRSFISIEGGPWMFLGDQSFRVSSNTYTSHDYNYDWTQVGTKFSYDDPYGYPSYVRFPFTY